MYPNYLPLPFSLSLSLSLRCFFSFFSNSLSLLSLFLSLILSYLSPSPIPSLSLFLLSISLLTSLVINELLPNRKYRGIHQVHIPAFTDTLSRLHNILQLFFWSHLCLIFLEYSDHLQYSYV